ncbi:hypothetical protein ZWY2020_034851 [Hordeum vulgare]|nr:hypothetical protein ZWY2020_034851 [Hordeum vulgare]
MVWARTTMARTTMVFKENDAPCRFIFGIRPCAPPLQRVHVTKENGDKAVDDPSFGIACLRKVNVVYENDMDLMIKLYQFVSKLLKPGGVSLCWYSNQYACSLGTRFTAITGAEAPRTSDVCFFSYYVVGKPPASSHVLSLLLCVVSAAIVLR